MRTLHELPRFADRWSYLYLEMGTLDQTAAGLEGVYTFASDSIPHACGGEPIFRPTVTQCRAYSPRVWG